MKKILLIILMFAAISATAQISDEALQDTIDYYIKTNNSKAITAAQLNRILTHLNTNKLNVDSVGAAADFTLTTTGTSGPSTYTGGVLNIPIYTSGFGGSSPWREDWGSLFYPPGFDDITALMSPDDSIVGIEKPYFGDIQRKSLTGYNVYNLLAIKLQPNNFRMVANKYYEINSSWFRGNVDSINAYLVNFPETKRLIVDTITTMYDDWNIPADKIIEFKNGGYITASSTVALNADNTTIVAGDFKIVGSNVNLYNDWKAETIYPEWFGTLGDGVTNDYAALNKFFQFLNICEYEKASLGRGKSYYIGSQITLSYTKPINLDGNYSKILYPYAEATGSYYPLTLNNTSVYTKDVDADIASGATSITLDNTTGLASGMIIRIVSTETWRTEKVLPVYPYTVTKYNKGFVSRITQVTNSTTIQVADPLPFSMATASVTAVYVFNPHEVNISNLSIEGTGSIPVADYRLTCLKLNDFYNSTIDNCTFKGGYFGINCSAAYNSEFKDIVVPIVPNNTASSTGRYGIGVSLFTNSTITNPYIITNGHCITFTGEPSVNARINGGVVHQLGDAHSLDSHSSYSVFVTGTKFWGTWWNFGKIVFENCQVYSAGGHIFDYRIGYKGDLDLTFNDCDIIFDSTYTSESYILRPETSGTYPLAGETFASVNITNNRIYNPRSAVVIFQERNIYGSNDGGGTLNVSGNFFKGTTVRLSRHYSGEAAATNRGNYIFRNNIYDNLILDSDVNYEIFDTYVIEGNTPRNQSSTFDIDLASYTNIGYVFKNNEIQGHPVNITSNTAGLVFTGNTVSSASLSTITGNTGSKVEMNRWGTTPVISGSTFDTYSALNAYSTATITGNTTLGGKFTYGDNVYGLATYTGGGYTLATSSGGARQQVINLSLSNNKNCSISSSKITLAKTGVMDIQGSITIKNASATCSTFTIVAELYNSSDTKLSEVTVGEPEHCTTGGITIPINTTFNSTNANNYIVLKIAGSAAVDITVKNVMLKISKIDE